jgi:hypothetical protein
VSDGQSIVLLIKKPSNLVLKIRLFQLFFVGLNLLRLDLRLYPNGGIDPPRLESLLGLKALIR